MREITSHRLIWLKGGVFAAIGIASGLVLIAESGTVRVGVLWALSVWALCRAYYFAFYVIEHYVDPGYRFSGLLSFAAYVLRRRH